MALSANTHREVVQELSLDFLDSSYGLRRFSVGRSGFSGVEWHIGSADWSVNRASPRDHHLIARPGTNTPEWLVCSMPRSLLANFGLGCAH